MASDPLVIHAPNVYQGGGKALLAALLSAFDADGTGHMLLDGRLQVTAPVPSGMTVRSYAPNIAGRLRADAHLSRVVETSSHVRSFAESGADPVNRIHTTPRGFGGGNVRTENGELGTPSTSGRTYA